MTTKHIFSITILLSLLLIPVHGIAGIDSLSSAINKARRQRMLTQRIIATYSQIGMDILTRKSTRQLNDAVN